MGQTMFIKKKKNNSEPTLLDDFLPHFLRRDRFSTFIEEDLLENERKDINVEFRSIDNFNCQTRKKNGK